MTYCIRKKKEKKEISFYEKQNSINFIFSIHSTSSIKHSRKENDMKRLHCLFQQRPEIDEIIGVFFSREYLTKKR
jgi:hypothetical protein